MIPPKDSFQNFTLHRPHPLAGLESHIVVTRLKAIPVPQKELRNARHGMTREPVLSQVPPHFCLGGLPAPIGVATVPDSLAQATLTAEPSNGKYAFAAARLTKIRFVNPCWSSA